MADTAPLYGMDHELKDEESDADAIGQVDVSLLVGVLWDAARKAEDLNGGTLQDALVAAGVAVFGHADEDEADDSDYLEEGDPCLRLTAAGEAMLTGGVTVSIETETVEPDPVTS